MEEIYGAAPHGPSRFFEFAFVYNYCPLVVCMPCPVCLVRGEQSIPCKVVVFVWPV